MVICKNCYIPMIGVMSFSKDKHEKFCRCPKGMAETRHTKLDDSGLNFGEYLHREIKKGN